MQSAKAAKDASRSREGWRLGNALLSAERLDEAEDLFQASPCLCLESNAHLSWDGYSAGHSFQAWRRSLKASEPCKLSANDFSGRVHTNLMWGP